MFADIEKKIGIIRDSQELIWDDKLSKLIERYDDSELYEEELDLVSAAKAEPEYQKFLFYANQHLGGRK